MQGSYLSDGILGGANCSGGSSGDTSVLADWQNYVSAGHFNLHRASIGLECGYQAVGGLTTAQINAALVNIETYLDHIVSLAQQSGVYIMIEEHDAMSGGCVIWADTTALWQGTGTQQGIAARYANDTNVFYQIQNEPDYGSCAASQYSVIEPNEQAIYNIIRAVAPNTPVLVWTIAKPDIFMSAGGVAIVQSEPGISYANATVDFHAYDSLANIQALVNAMRGAGYPVTMSEFTDCTPTPDNGPPWATLLAYMQSAQISWVCGDGYPYQMAAPPAESRAYR
jgi:hypothetical protein